MSGHDDPAHAAPLDLEAIRDRVREAGAISRTLLALPPETPSESLQFIARASVSAMDVPALVAEVERLRALVNEHSRVVHREQAKRRRAQLRWEHAQGVLVDLRRSINSASLHLPDYRDEADRG